jgi:K+-sensing histidine kinase KdpD
MRLVSWLRLRLFSLLRWRCPVQVQPDLMARLSHELRTTLTGIVGYSEFLEIGANEPMTGFTAKIIRENGHSLTRVTQSFFDFYALRNDGCQLICSHFLLLHVLRQVIEKNRSIATELGVFFKFSYSNTSQAQLMLSDKVRVGQVLDALVLGTLHLRGYWTGETALTLSDSKKVFALSFTVSAVEAHQHARLVEDFWINENYKFHLQDGPGMELALARELLGLLGGWVELKSGEQRRRYLVVYLPTNFSRGAFTRVY